MERPEPFITDSTLEPHWGRRLAFAVVLAFLVVLGTLALLDKNHLRGLVDDDHPSDPITFLEPSPSPTPSADAWGEIAEWAHANTEAAIPTGRANEGVRCDADARALSLSDSEERYPEFDDDCLAAWERGVDLDALAVPLTDRVSGSREWQAVKGADYEFGWVGADDQVPLGTVLQATKYMVFDVSTSQPIPFENRHIAADRVVWITCDKGIAWTADSALPDYGRVPAADAACSDPDPANQFIWTQVAIDGDDR